MNALHEEVVAFFASREPCIALPSRPWGSPAPFQERRAGLAVVTGAGRLHRSRTPARGLQLPGALEHGVRDSSFLPCKDSAVGRHHRPASVEVEGEMAQGVMSLSLAVYTEPAEERANQRVERTR
jgi:hypothetical protein